MNIQINEVWNREGRSKQLAIVAAEPNQARQAVWNWITTQRPDLTLASGIYDHGFHAIEVKSPFQVVEV